MKNNIKSIFTAPAQGSKCSALLSISPILGGQEVQHNANIALGKWSAINTKQIINKLDVHCSQYGSRVQERYIDIYENIINSKSNTTNTNKNVDILPNNNNSIATNNINIFDFLSKINKFNSKLATNKYITSPFNKSFPFEGLSTKQRGTIESLPFSIASKIIKYTFLSIGVLISKPVFSILYSSNRFDSEYSDKPNRKIFIQLFYYVKTPKYRLFSKFSKFNHETIKDIDLIEDTQVPAPPAQSAKMESAPLSSPSHIYGIGSSGVENLIKIRNNILVTFNNRLEYLVQFLGHIFNSDIELECVRLNKTYFESNILVQDLAMKSYRNRFVKLTRKLFRKAYTFDPTKTYELQNYLAYPSLLSGINIKLAGRAFKQRIIPRMTVKYAQKGTLTNLNVKLLDKGRFTGKTRRGSFTFTVTLAHLIK